jgi:glycosyltransferase involved in cell wall biosynthesis
VTVVVPTLGASPFFGEAVASAAAEQPAEVIVVADGPGARPARPLGDRTRLVELPHREGRSAARNAGVETAQTPFVAFLDDDDVLVRGGLVRLRDSLAHAPGAALAFGRARVIDAAGRPLPRWDREVERRFRAVAGRPLDAAALLATRAPLYTSATIVRTGAFLAAGGYDRRLAAHEDLDLYLRLARKGSLVGSGGEPVTAYRLHGANTPSDRLYEGLLAVTEKHLPDARGALRRRLLERRVDALWGLGRFGQARREALRAAREEPRLLAEPRFARRLAGTLVPRRLLGARG